MKRYVRVASASNMALANWVTKRCCLEEGSDRAEPWVAKGYTGQ